MSKKVLVNLDLLGNSLLNVVLNPLATAPSNAKPFYIYTSTANETKGTVYVNIGTYQTPSWLAIGAVTSVNGKTGVITLTQDDVGNGTTYVRTHNDLTDALVALVNGALQKAGGTMSGAIAMGGNKITGLANGTAATDAATFGQIPTASGNNPTMDGTASPGSSAQFAKGDHVHPTDTSRMAANLKGAAGGVAELDANGKVLSSQLPSYVDDVIEGYLYNGKFYAEAAHTTEIAGESGKIFIDLATEKTYRWSGSAFAEISSSLALGETSSTAYRGDRGKTAYDHSQLTSGNPHNVSKSDVGLGNADNTSDATKKSNFTGSIANGNTGFVTGGDVYDALSDKQDEIAANGILKGDGAGGVAAATPVTDYGTYSKPSGGIPKEDLATAIQNLIDGALQKTGGTMSGNIAMGSHKITGLATPTDNADAATKDYVDTAVGNISGTVKLATGTIDTNSTSATVSFSGTVINAYATMGGAMVITDVSIGASAVNFSIAESPSSAVTCVVVYV